MTSKPKTNTFSLGAQVGGLVPIQVFRDEQRLRDLMNRWSGNYSRTIRAFAFLLRVDGDIHTYTKMWNIEGAQTAKRKRDWVEVEIGVPERWWAENEGRGYKVLLAEAIEDGLRSMIELLRRNGHDIRADALLKDWQKIKSRYLTSTASESAELKETDKQLRKIRYVMVSYRGTLATLSKQKKPIQ